jgi:hypothetical protein
VKCQDRGIIARKPQAALESKGVPHSTVASGDRRIHPATRGAQKMTGTKDPLSVHGHLEQLPIVLSRVAQLAIVQSSVESYLNHVLPK